MGQKNKGCIINLNKIYKETLKDCGKNASNEFVKQEFLYVLKEVGVEFLKELEENEQKTNS